MTQAHERRRLDRDLSPSQSPFEAFDKLDFESFSPPVRRLAKALMLYKSMFAGPWFAALSEEEDGLPVDIDFSWEKEGFAITSRARVSLAEIVTEMGSGDGDDGAG